MEESLKRKIPQRPPIMPLLPTIEEEDRLSWLRLMWRYRLQFQSMASPSVVIIAGGMKLAWSVFESPPSNIDHVASTHLLVSAWFVGVISGSIIAATFVQRTSKNVAYCGAGSLLMIGGLLFAIFPTAFAALFISCIVEGCAFGVVTVQALITGSEVAHKDIRGLLLSFERISMWFGVSLQLIYIHLWYEFEPATGYRMHPHRLHGMLIFVLGMLGIGLALWHRLESPALLQMQHHDSIATWTIRRYHGIHDQPSSDLLRMRDDYKQMIAFDAGLSWCKVFWQQNAFALLKVTILRCFVALSVSLPFNRVFLMVGSDGLNCNMNCIFLLSFSGLIGSCAGSLLVDGKGRRKLCVITLLLSGIFMFFAGGIFRHLKTYDIPVCQMDLEMAAYLMLLNQFCTSFGSSTASTIYAGEAFTLSMKAKCIAAMTVCEYTLQVALVAMAYHVDYTNWLFLFSLGTLSLLLGLLVFLFMPETQLLPLSECLIKFRKFPRT